MNNFCQKHIFKIHGFMRAKSTFEPKVDKCIIKLNPTNFNFLFLFNYQYYDHSNYEKEWCTFDKGKKTFE